jgi:hypothetical protein
MYLTCILSDGAYLSNAATKGFCAFSSKFIAKFPSSPLGICASSYQYDSVKSSIWQPYWHHGYWGGGESAGFISISKTHKLVLA